jgi:hypothetical protein
LFRGNVIRGNVIRGNVVRGNVVRGNVIRETLLGETSLGESALYQDDDIDIQSCQRVRYKTLSIYRVRVILHEKLVE